MPNARAVVALIALEPCLVQIVIKRLYAVETAVAVGHTGKIKRRRIETK